jgi:hypothetical protein
MIMVDVLVQMFPKWIFKVLFTPVLTRGAAELYIVSIDTAEENVFA